MSFTPIEKMVYNARYLILETTQRFLTKLAPGDTYETCCPVDTIFVRVLRFSWRCEDSLLMIMLPDVSKGRKKYSDGVTQRKNRVRSL